MLTCRAAMMSSMEGRLAGSTSRHARTRSATSWGASAGMLHTYGGWSVGRREYDAGWWVNCLPKIVGQQGSADAGSTPLHAWLLPRHLLTECRESGRAQAPRACRSPTGLHSGGCVGAPGQGGPGQVRGSEHILPRLLILGCRRLQRKAQVPGLTKWL